MSAWLMRPRNAAPPVMAAACKPPGERGRGRAGRGAAALADDVQRVSDSVRSALECPVCMGLLDVVSMCCDNGHGTCHKCSYTMNQLHPLTPPKCPLCRSPATCWDACAPAGRGSRQQATVVRSSMMPPLARKLHQFMSFIKVTCAYRQNGCPDLVYVSPAAVHDALCPYAPHVRCMVPYCQWSGAYRHAFQHVNADHQYSAYDVLENQFMMPDLTFGLQGNVRRAYLTRNVQDGNRLYWVCVAQQTLTGTQVAVLKVFDPDVPTKFTDGPPHMVFRVRTVGRKGWSSRQRGQPRPVCWDRVMLARMVKAAAGEGREKCMSTLHAPMWCTATVHNGLQYDAIITWNAVVW